MRGLCYKLKSLSVENKEALQLVREEGVVNLISPIQCHKLSNGGKRQVNILHSLTCVGNCISNV